MKKQKIENSVFAHLAELEAKADKKKEARPITKLIYITSLFVLLAAFIMIAVLIYWSIAPTNVLTIKNNPVPVKEKTVKAGEPIILFVDYCKYREAAGSVQPSIVSQSQVTLLPSYTDTGPITCSTHTPIPIIIPPQLQPDTYHVHYFILYQINPIREGVVQFNSQDFTVIK